MSRPQVSPSSDVPPQDNVTTVGIANPNDSGTIGDGSNDSGARRVVDEGPGWLPAIMAATVLMGIAGFIFCGVTTWFLFQKRTELAARTIEAYQVDLDQSYLDPETKTEVVEVISRLGKDLQGGRYENWQSAGILQRLQRVPVLQWGRLQAVIAFYRTQSDATPEQIATIDQDVSRLLRAIEIGQVTSFDLQDVLEPVQVPDPNSSNGFRMIQPMKLAAAKDVIERIQILAAQAKIPEQTYPDIKLESIVKTAIEEGAEKGTF